MANAPLVWHDKMLANVGDVIDAIVKIQSREEAGEFLAIYEQHVDEPWIAKANIGYFTGYLSDKTADRILDLFDTRHPIFGRSHPTAEAALNAGISLGLQGRRRDRIESVSGLDVAERTCRVCGCTDRDCRVCIEKTGEPCYWVTADLCSACTEPRKP